MANAMAGAGCSSGDGGVDPAATCGPEGTVEACYSGPPAVRGIGACQDGARTCRSGTWSACNGEGLPQDEVCGDEVDDDCNGVADDGCPCPSGATRGCYDGPASTRGIGLCRDGTQACVNDVWASECEGSVVPEPEGCDSLDRDCNGIPDTACSCVAGESRSCYTGPPSTEGVGVCRSGMQSCQGDVWPTVCPGEVVPTDESCDATDTDCDGAIDYAGCLSRIERFWNTDICSHQYKADSTTPDGGYVYEAGEHFYVYRTAVPGAVPLYQLSDGSRHLVTLDPSEGPPIGYNQTETLGYVLPAISGAWAVGDFEGTEICRYTTTVCSDHVIGLASEPPAEGYTVELCLGVAWGWRS